MVLDPPPPYVPEKECCRSNQIACSCFGYGSERNYEMPSGLNETDEQIITLTNIDRDLRPGDLIILGDHTYSIFSIKYCFHGEIEIEVHWKSSKIVD